MELKEYRNKIANLTIDEQILRNLYLRNLAIGKVQGPNTGYASIDKPWLKYYDEDILSKKPVEMTVYEYLYKNNYEHMQDIAIEYFDKKITYEQLFENIKKVEEAFIQNDVKKGDIVTICMPATPEVIYSFYALNKIGAISNMIDPRMNKESIEYFLNEVNSKILLTIDLCIPKIEPIIKNTSVEQAISISVSNSMPILFKILYNVKQILDKSLPKQSKTFEKWNNFIINDNKTESEINGKAFETATIVHTSGTSGTPKAVPLTNNNLNNLIEQYKTNNLEIKRHQRFLDIIPPFAAYGLCGSIHMPLSLGLTTILIPKFEAKEFANLILKYKPTHVLGVPSFWENMAKSDANIDLSFLVSPGAGGDGISVQTEKFINDYLLRHGSNSKLIKGYGMTELSSSACTCMTNTNELTSVGIPLFKNTISIFDPETMEELGYNRQGEICICGPTMMTGYYNNEQLTESIIKRHSDNQKWIHTGDLGYITENGVLYVEGRLKRMIVRFDGFKIYPSMIEKVINKHNAVDSSVVVCYNDPSIGKMPKAYVVLKDEYHDSSEEIKKEIKLLCEKELSERTVPYDFEIIDELPLTVNGKIDTSVLEQPAIQKIKK